MNECELELVSQPKIEITQLEKGKEFIFTAEVAVKPEVKLGEYKGLKVDKVSTRVTQKEVDEEIDKERERNARTIDVTDRAVQDKDQITLDFEGFVDGVAFEGGKASDYPLTIGSGAFIPGFEDQLIGANIDEEKEINVTFPEEYQAKELAGKAAVFKCTVHSIKAKELPELDDEFVSDVSEKSETVDAYKQKKAEDQRAQRKRRKAKERRPVCRAGSCQCRDGYSGSYDQLPVKTDGRRFRSPHYAAGYDDGTVLPVYRSFGRKDDGRV